MQAINGKLYAFVTLERAGGVMVYDVTDPANASFVSYEPPAPFSACDSRSGRQRAGDGDQHQRGRQPDGRAAGRHRERGRQRHHGLCGGDADPTIQGTGHASAFGGQTVTTLGVVTAVDTNGSRGFYIQDPNGDGNAATSDAIFVFTNAAPTPRSSGRSTRQRHRHGR